MLEAQKPMCPPSTLSPQSSFDSIFLVNGEYKINYVYQGQIMTITEFADAIFGNTPQRTQFLLKHQKEMK
ncbi:hypothetical protein UFOVP94_23 [uncultured Caudovirales phage]|uniref:Uncharacterized protein n=1 Tax=uncultured Caudovirales phage TaxID=2100421 RepID=A0A6J5L1W2_9CAUD|nr:hypothetical protein UFOVP94_23 [uncultured Caudovirales phage]CAB5212478.1 hypothetical protein UFOVP186_20 [uncultured Caudovirales phage]